MYYQHFNLEKKPFSINSDNEFLWLGKKHAKALELLKNGIKEEQGLLALIGDVGTGKTTLLNEIIHTLDAKTLWVKIADPGIEMHHLFLTIAQTFEFEDQYQKRKPFSSDFFSFLKTTGRKGQKVLVIVDEAQRIPDRFLKEVASWSGFGLSQVLTVILAGQLEFRDVLRSALGPAWQDCIKTHAFLEPLNELETKTYVNKRLEMAGTNRKIFILSAVHEVYTYSKGFPRMINTSCDQALIAAFAKGMKIVDDPTVKEATGQLDLPTRPSKNEEEQPHEKTLKLDRPWFQKKRLAGLAVAVSICLFIGYLFHTGYLLHAIGLHEIKKANDASPLSMESLDNMAQAATESLQAFKDTKTDLDRTIHPIVPQPTDNQSTEVLSAEVRATEDQPDDGKTPEDQHIGQGYTPATFSDEDELSSPVLKKDNGEINLTEQTVKNVDWFIKEVFLFKEQTIAEKESPAESKPIAGMGQLSGSTSSEAASPMPDSPMNISQDRSTEPEPDAIIDWLFKNRKIE